MAVERISLPSVAPRLAWGPNHPLAHARLGRHAAPTPASGPQPVSACQTESLGHYAEWFGVSAMGLRRINHLAFGRPVRIGERIRLDFARVTRQQFEQRRIAYHRALEASYFASHRIEDTGTYVTRNGDSLWTLTQRFFGAARMAAAPVQPEYRFLCAAPGDCPGPRILGAAAAG